MAAVEREYARYFTSGEKPRAQYDAVIKAVDAAREEHQQHAAQVAALAGYVDEYARQEEQARAAQAELPDAREDAALRAAEAAEAAALKERAQAAAERLARELVTLERAEKDLAGRDAVRERAAEAAKQAAELAQRVAPAREAAEAEEAKIAELTAARDAAKTAVETAREAPRRAGRVRELARAKEALADAVEALGRAEKADAEYAALLESAPERPITDKDIRALDAAATEVTLQRTLREAAAAKLEVTGPAGASALIDGTEQPLSETPATLAVYDGTEVALGEYTVVFRAGRVGSGGDAAAGDALEKAERTLAELLERVRCDSVEEARRLRDVHAEHAAKLAAARQRRDDLLGGKDVAALRAQRAGLEREVEALAAELSGVEGGEGNVDKQEAALAGAERELEQAEAALRPYLERPAAQALTRAEILSEAKAAEAKGAAAELEAAEASAPRETLKAALEAARVAVAGAKAEADELAAASAAAEPELAQKLADGAANRVVSLEKRHADARTRITELSARIELAAGAAERADRAKAALEAAEAALASMTRRAEAAKLLRDTMVAHRDAARARYAAPFNEALRTHARMIYGPSVDFGFGDALDITQRTVDGTPIPVADLSGGAKEQLAILTRFAIADVVTASGGTAPVPVIVDDALGATDPERLIRMNLLFEEVGKRAQVLVLTCYPQRFDRVDAARRFAIEDLKTGSR
ncbi:hypothetical protein JKI95_02050 [Corynebacterium aquatimens]|uniref:ATP-binding protein n=2 Tax=Corynebacterium TaxID=1716 RepID=UPI00253FFF7D|nr:hypothetical protein [Corynebacterium aquatimens]QYH19902.1 hypothetical protein JKI95_02050 [Corynebacterium aquatimens]